MNTDRLPVLVLGALLLPAAFAADSAPYCPPGAKYCPAPGTDNTVFLDTHFGIDAQTGKLTAYKGTVHPDEVNNPAPAQESVLYVQQPINVENRYVPNPNVDAPLMANVYAPPSRQLQPTGYAPNPGVYQAPAMENMYAQPQVKPTPSVTQAQLAMPDVRSEVADKQTERASPPTPVPSQDKKPWWKPWGKGNKEQYEDNRVPWWKGGMWRNRNNKNDAGKTTVSASTTPQSRDSMPSSGGSNYGNATDYDPDAAPGQYYRQQSVGGNEPFDPYGLGSTPQNTGVPTGYVAQNPPTQYDSYGYPAVGTTVSPVYVGDSYTLPNSPPPSSPYAPGYTYPGTSYSADLYTQQQPIQEYPAQYQNPYPQAYDSYSTMQPQSAPSYSAPQDLFGAPPPENTIASQPMIPSMASDDTGSADFQRAVQLVKDGRFTEAKTLLASETSMNPSQASAWRWLGDCHYNLLELDAAITSYDRALGINPNDYYALRGEGFAYLHRGHEYWRRMQEEVQRGSKDQAASTFAQAHDNYKKSLEQLGMCLRRAPNDSEAIYGEAMAAEGASRKLYSNAISYLKLGPENRERAELFAENCLTVINKGIERARERSRLNPGESGPRALLGGLYLRKAILYHNLGKNDLALIELKNSRDVQQSILDDIDKNNTTAQKGVAECQSYWNQWGGDELERQAAGRMY